LHADLRRDASVQAASAVAELLEVGNRESGIGNR
jgi:hypothetical protein